MKILNPQRKMILSQIKIRLFLRIKCKKKKLKEEVLKRKRDFKGRNKGNDEEY